MCARHVCSAVVQRQVPVTQFWTRTSTLMAVMYISLVLKSLSLKRTLQLVGRANRRPARSSVSPADLAAAVDWALSLRRPLLRRNCLRRALSLFYLLRRQGIPVQLHLGVRKQAGGESQIQSTSWHLNGHAWLTLDDRIFLEPDHAAVATYVETYRYGGNACRPLPLDDTHVASFGRRQP